MTSCWITEARSITSVAQRTIEYCKCILILCCALVGTVGCYSVATRTDGGATEAADHGCTETSTPIGLDLLLVVDNSGAMAENQIRLGASIRTLISALALKSRVASDAGGEVDREAYFHLGVVSTDLGGPDNGLIDCRGNGDDGMLNPQRYGMSTTTPGHLAGPRGIRPDDCGDFPSFLSFHPGSDLSVVTHDAQCISGLSIWGCGFEQPLEAAYRALVSRRVDSHVGGAGVDGGFLRDSAILVILILSDEDDASIRDCRYAEQNQPGGIRSCSDATDVFNPLSTAWASDSDANLRTYLYRPCSAQDPTWTLDRYIDARNPSRGFLALKPDHPEFVIFAAIAGIPLRIPMSGPDVPWDRLLGSVDASSPDNFCERRSSEAVAMMSPEGPISMRQGSIDPTCARRVVPSCYREGTAYDQGAHDCNATGQDFAWPARRIVEVARRFEQAPLCHGQPCHNSVVASICAQDYTPAMVALSERIRRRLTP